ncbi:MAG TPA: quinone oxidoreductase, partial [Rugosimonospora sp.]|nr:quinone oxidoreductase [Rugosimonospora sp.]
MRAIRVTETGEPEVLRIAELATPEPGPGQVLVRVEAAGVNFVDTYRRGGLYPVPLPHTPGTEGAGTVAALGTGVDTVAVGDRVASVDMVGAYAEYALAPADRLVPVPDNVTTRQAAAVLLQGITAHYLVNDSFPVRVGDPVLVHAAAGGVGLLLTQLAKAAGGQVIATTSTPEKAELARAAGADEVLGYDGFAAQVRKLTGGEGVAAVYDGIGATTFEESLASLRVRGTLVVYGYASGRPPLFDIDRLQHLGSLYVTRPTMGHFIRTREELLARAGALLAAVGD